MLKLEIIQKKKKKPVLQEGDNRGGEKGGKYDQNILYLYKIVKE